MSRRDKQAELRRRMAEARSKLSSSKTQAAALDDDGAAGKKRPLPPPEGGGGGILRKSKYTPVTTGAAASVEPTNAERGSNEQGGQHPPLGALMAGYDDSSSDEEEGAPASAVANNQHQQSKSANNGSEEEPVKKKQKRAKFSSQVVRDRAIADAAAMVQLPVTEVEEEGEHQEPSIQKDNVDTPSDKQAQGGNNDKKKASAEISDDVWDEFNSLLEDDGAKITQDTALANPKDRTSPAELVPHQTTNNDESSSSKKKKKKKSKKKKKKHRDEPTTTDMYENEEAMTNVEQASYEARLARLVLLKSKKTQQQHNKNNGTAATDDTNDNLLSTEEFYDPGLAFQQEDNEDVEEDAQVDPTKNQTMEKSNLKIDEGVLPSETQPQQTSSVNAPARVSLAKILRDRRDQARQLSSRGGGGGGSANVDDSKSNDGIEDDSTDDAPDGCWF